MKILFAIPDSRLVDVWYKKGDANHFARIPNPGNPENLVVVMLQKKVGMSQVKCVRPVIEHARKSN